MHREALELLRKVGLTKQRGGGLGYAAHHTCCALCGVSVLCVLCVCMCPVFCIVWSTALTLPPDVTRRDSEDPLGVVATIEYLQKLGGEVLSRNARSTHQPGVFCMSWYADFEFRGTRRTRKWTSSASTASGC